jgi:hypothetical protein
MFFSLSLCDQRRSLQPPVHSERTMSGVSLNQLDFQNETGPTVGEYFLYAAYSCSKRALPEWYPSTAVQQIRPVDVHALDSDGYWKKWDRVGEERDQDHC